mgnify:CR=1 FL=1
MRMSNSDLSLLSEQQKELLNLMQTNQEILIRIEEYLKILFVYNIVSDYESVTLQHNQKNRKFLLTRLVNVISTLLQDKLK